jgi:hypothetical protein
MEAALREDRLITPPEDPPSWKRVDSRRRGLRSVTREFFGDPSFERSALGGWQQRGDDFMDAGHFDSARGVRERAKPDGRRPHAP